MDQFTFTLSSPITEEQFDEIMDVDFEKTERIYFNTKHGAVVEFVKVKEPKTNADRIRAITDEEELADALFYGQFLTKQDTLDWLKQEAQ